MNKLTGLNILITRSEPQATLLAEMIHACGGTSMVFPTVAFAPPENPEMITKQVARLAQQDWIIFISPQAVHASMPVMKQHLKAKIAAVGKGTAQLLSEYGFADVFFPSQDFSVQGLLASANFQSMSKQKIAIIRGEGTHAELAKSLGLRGAEVM
jgi:uroporphyrinogen-III synthase